VAKKDESTEQASKAGFNPATFLIETKEELGKVVWPSRQQLISESLSVVLMVVLSATLVYFIDGLFGFVAAQVFK
jgi:preprotein translocase subunit SecE